MQGVCVGKVRVFKGFVVGASSLISVFIALVVFSPSASAADNMAVNSRLSYGNATVYCGGGFAKGMVWLSNDSSNYYSESVTVGWNATSVDVQVRGAVNTCATPMGPRKENRAYADNVESRTENLEIKGTRFDRGTVPNLTLNAWSTKGEYLSATLDIKDIATCSGVKETKTGTAKTSIYRNLLWKKTAYDGSVTWTAVGDGIEHIDVQIRRSCPDVVHPKVQILGADLFVQGNIDTSRSSANDRTYGSWGEYALVAGGAVSGMASGSGYAGGRASASMCAVSLLTFSNARTGSCDTTALGGYTRAAESPLTATTQLLKLNPSKGTISGTVSLDTLEGGKVYYATGNITLRASSPIAKGKWVVIMADAHDVRIDRSIEYFAGPLNTLREIPQVVVIGRNITIADSVTHLDAWLLAAGTAPHGVLKTCDAPGVNEPLGLTRSVCNQRLTVNGPVMARTIQLYRTTGDVKTPGIGQAAEVFNLRADAYLWAAAQNLAVPRVTTQSTAELPPRF